MTISDPNPSEELPVVGVAKDERGKWWVTLDGVKVSDHRNAEAARIAAQGHLPWPARASGNGVGS